MKNLVSFSGGKDSTALILHLKERGIEFEAVFCDTGWEHRITYKYIDYIDKKVLDGKLKRIRSEKYDTMENLVRKKKRVPSRGARFCTEELKVKPFIHYVKSIDDEVIVYQGIRADESPSRSRMKEREFSDDYDAWIVCPLLKWNVTQVFSIHERHGIKVNELYTMGASRVGCFPCIMVSHRDLRNFDSQLPEVWERAQRLEDTSGRSFFPPNFIPARYHSGYDPKSEKTYPTVEDVKRYIKQNESQLELLPAEKCMSVYNLCE